MEKRTKGKLRTHATAVWLAQRMVDSAIVAGAHAVTVQQLALEWRPAELLLMLAGVICFQFIAEINGVYESWRTSPLRQELSQTVWSWTLVVPVLVVARVFFFDTMDFAHSSGFLWWLLGCPAALVTFKLVMRLVLRAARVQGRNSRTVGVAGATPMALHLLQDLMLRPDFGMKVAGIYDDRSAKRLQENLAGFDLVGNLDKAVEDARSGRLDVLYITLPFKAEERIGNIVRELADTTATVHLIADFSAFELLHARFAQVAGYPAISITDTPFEGLGGWLKRAEDLVLATLILVLISPIMAVIAALIKWDSPGPVFFSQERCGLNGKPFKVFKFRSMRVAEDGHRVVQATRNDPRVTRLGAFLRRSSLDELPQFINVILGDMSIVGPRPHAAVHNEQYRRLVHRYMLRHKVKPGITGWAQVNGWRGETDTVDKMEKRVEYDLQYINNWSLSWDIEIIVRTALTFAGHKQAY